MQGMDAPHDSVSATKLVQRSSRSGVFAAFGILAFAVVGSAVGRVGPVASAAAPPNIRVDGDRRADAALRDVFFADPDRGWAVGDLGTILATSDGGNSWVPQKSGTSCNLRSVTFLTPDRGLAVGGWYERDTGLGRGVILRTRDGGRSWESIPTDLPPLHSIRRIASGSLVAVGDWSPMHLGRLFVSEDDGENWRRFGADELRQVETVHVGLDGVLATDAQGVLFASGSASTDFDAIATLPDVQGLAAAGPHVAAALGDATVAVSRDAGRSWQHSHPGPVLPLCAAAVAEGFLWVAGAPGTQVWRIDPEGNSVVYDTGVHGPLYALHFHDQHRGWAVGGLGRIIATRDGGRSWRVQRGANERAMLLGVANHPAELPWPVLASEALELGNRFAVAVGDGSPSTGMVVDGSARPGDFDPLAASLEGRTIQAAVELGGGDVLRWRSAAEGTDSIAAVIASSAPSVVVLGADLSDAERDRWLSEAVRGGVARVFDVSGESRADLTIHASAVLPVAGAITADLWADAFALLSPDRAVPQRLFLRRRWDQSRSDRLVGGVSDGLASGGGRRMIPDGRRRNFQILQARSGELQLIERLIQDARSLDHQTLEKNLSLLVQQTPTENRERLLRKLLHHIEATRDHQPGDVRLYLATLAEAAGRMPESGLGRKSDLRLKSILQSSEWRDLVARAAVTREERPQSLTERVAAHSSPFEKYDSPVLPVAAVEITVDPITAEIPPTAAGPEAAGPEAAVPEVAVPEVAVSEAAVLGAAGLPPSAGESAIAAVAPTVFAGAHDMLWQMHPAVLLWKGASGRSAMTSWDRGATDRLGDSVSAGSWKDLADPAAEDCIAAASTVRGGEIHRPLLDGRLDDVCWEESFDSAAGAAGDDPSIHFAYDADFVYFALRGSFGDDDAAQPVGHRQRDSDLRPAVRAVLEIDVDRDLLTSYELAIDARGHTRDTCNGFTNWQPMWYVATELESGVRTIEAAIRRRDLVELPPVAGDQWRVRARIIAPNNLHKNAPIVDPTGWRTLVFD